MAGGMELTVEYGSSGNGVGHIDLTMAGARIAIEYTDSEALISLVYQLPQVLAQASDMDERGETERVEVPRSWQLGEL